MPGRTYRWGGLGGGATVSVVPAWGRARIVVAPLAGRNDAVLVVPAPPQFAVAEVSVVPAPQPGVDLGTDVIGLEEAEDQEDRAHAREDHGHEWQQLLLPGGARSGLVQWGHGGSGSSIGCGHGTLQPETTADLAARETTTR
jgi:hypothetical protein